MDTKSLPDTHFICLLGTPPPILPTLNTVDQPAMNLDSKFIIVGTILIPEASHLLLLSLLFIYREGPGPIQKPYGPTDFCSYK